MADSSGSAQVRPARPDDVPGIHALICELASYERSLDQVSATEADLRIALFGPAPVVFAHVATVQDRVVGYVLWFLNYSTWTGTAGIYLEDLYLTPSARGTGLGAALLAELAALCVTRGYARLDWVVLDWNTPAAQFFAAQGAARHDEWRLHRLSGDALAAAARRATSSGPA